MAIVHLPDDVLVTAVRHAYDQKHDPFLHRGLHIDTRIPTPTHSLFSDATTPSTETCPSFASSRTSPSSSFYSPVVHTPVSPSVVDDPVDDPATDDPVVPFSDTRPASSVAPPPTLLATSFYARQNQQQPASSIAYPSPLALNPHPARLDDIPPAARSNWPTCIPKHMLGVFRTFSSAIESVPYDDEPTRRGKRGTSDSPSGTRRSHEKRRRVESLHVPFPATGPLPMFSGEFYVDLSSDQDIHNGHAVASHPTHVDPFHPGYRLSAQQRPASFSALAVGEPMEVDGPSYAAMDANFPEDHSLHLAYPDDGPYNAPPQHNYHPVPYGCHIPTPKRHFLPSFPLTDSGYGGFEYSQHQPSAHMYGSSVSRYAPYVPHPPPVAPPSTASQTHGLNLISLPTVPPLSAPGSPPSHPPFKSNEAGPKRFLIDGQVVYACHLCERTFPFPNGLALHIKWHGKIRAREHAARESNPKADASSPPTVSRRGSSEWPVVATDGTKDENVVAAANCAYVPPDMDPSAAAYMSQGYMLSHSAEYTQAAQKSSDSALFPQNGHFGAQNPYLAPLQGVPVLAPLPFSQNSWGHEGQY